MIRSADIRPRLLTVCERWFVAINVGAIVVLVREFVKGWKP